ncbi:MAG: hypothetical protein CSA24_01950 [Deltaproteobacteria bacterium]|nr:MAG: hypothetical protein CSB49_08170 [Pseudomonadota bacterium]PIE65795.1 MAG: hypothetical protein CSA24_01950 [Deltaproteobacteria bacterium]
MTSLSTTTRKRRHERGFSMIEMMIVVVIVAVLAAVAFVAYRRHIRKGYVIQATEFVTRIVQQQELMRQQNGHYTDMGSNAAYPALKLREPVQKAWTAIPGAWQTFGLRPHNNVSYFGFVVRASRPVVSHQIENYASNGRFGIPAQPTTPVSDPGYIPPHPWFYVIAVGDMDGDTNTACNSPNPGSITGCTMILASSARPSPTVYNQNE